MEQIEKTFLLKDKETQSKFTELLLNVPMEHILVSEKIINFGKIKLGKNLNEIIYVNLTDHIHSAIDRYREGLILKNPLRWDIARFYPDEYAVGEKAIEVVRNDLGCPSRLTRRPSLRSILLMPRWTKRGICLRDCGNH